jgi:hypothetical protein
MKTEHFAIRLKIDDSISETTDGQLNIFSTEGEASHCLYEVIASTLEDDESCDEVYYIDKIDINKSKKTIVRVAWNRRAADIFEEEGWKALEKASENGVDDLVFEEKEFNTPAEAIAYTEGINDANGWDEPMAEIIDNKIEEVN